MERHPDFELWLHDDAELSALLGAAITGRRTIHQWSLSCVQRVQTADGRRHIYKVQAPPTVEAEFYARARSPLLVPVRMLPSQGSTIALTMEDIPAPTLAESPPGATEAPAMAEDLVARIARIDGDPPVMWDISTPEGWSAYMGGALADMRFLVAEGRFTQVTPELLEDLRRRVESRPVLAAIGTPTGFLHSDLMAGNVLAIPDGHRVLDWQRPVRGPLALDVATLLISLGLDPQPHVPDGILDVYHLLHIAWYGQGARRWVPGNQRHLDRAVAHIATELAALR